MENPFEEIIERLSRIEHCLLDMKDSPLMDAERAKLDFNNKRLTRKDVCNQFQITPPTLHKHMKMGLPFEKIGRRTLFLRTDIDAYFNKFKTINHGN